MDAGHQYEIRPANDSVGRWEVILAKLDGSAPSGPEAEGSKIDYEIPIAFLNTSNEELTFDWNSQNQWAFGADRDRNLAGQLSNCILVLRHAEEQHAIRLRLLVRAEPLVVKLEEKEEETQLSLHNLPPRESLALKLTELNGFGATTEMIPSDGRIKLHDRGRVELYVGDQQEIRLRVEGELVDGGVTISLISHFKSGDSYKPLTPKTAKQELSVKQRLLENGRRDLEVATRNYNGAEAYRRRLGAPPSDPTKHYAWSKEVGKANSAMKKADGQIKRNTNMIASVKVVVAALEKMGDLATKLQEKSPAIDYSITTMVDGQERPLLVAGRSYSESATDSFSKTEVREGFGEPAPSNPILLAHYFDSLAKLLSNTAPDWSHGYNLNEATGLTPLLEECR